VSQGIAGWELFVLVVSFLTETHKLLYEEVRPFARKEDSARLDKICREREPRSLIVAERFEFFGWDIFIF
jgi:hypothetical protein